MDIAMEFQSEDKAWYGVKLLRNDDKLIIKYVNSPEEFNETVDVEKFKTAKELEDFKKRFRERSVQLQGQDCHKVVEGKTVCASFENNNGEVKFFDATVVQVRKDEHKFTQLGEKCVCKFKLQWHDGEIKGLNALRYIGNICLTPNSEQVDSSLASFLNIALERIENGSLRVNESAGSEESSSSTHRKNSYEKFVTERQRRNRYAFRTTEGRSHGHCKRKQRAEDEDEDVSSAS